MLSLIAARRGQLELAQQWLDDASTRAPHDPAVLSLLARLALTRGEHPTTVARTLLAPNPTTPSSPTLLALLEDTAPRTHQRAAARAARVFTLASTPLDPSARLQRASLLARVPALRPRALDVLEEHPWPLHANRLRADIAESTGDLVGALRLLDDTVRADPHPTLIRARANLLGRLQRSPERRAAQIARRDALIRMSREAPDDPKLHAALALAHLALGDPGSATRSAETCLGLRQSDPESLHLLILTLLALDHADLPTYRARLIQSLEDRYAISGSLHALLELASTLSKLAATPDSVERARELLESAPDTLANEPRLALLLADVYTIAHQPEHALTLYQRASEADPRLIDAWLGVADTATLPSRQTPALRAALALDLDRDDLRERLAQHLRSQNLDRLADNVWLERLRQPGVQTHALLALMRTLDERGMPTLAYALTLPMLSPFASSSPRYHVASAARLRALKRAPQALEAALEATHMTGRGTALLDHIEALLLEERDEEAKAALKRLPRELGYDFKRLEGLASHAGARDVHQWARCRRLGECGP